MARAVGLLCMLLLAGCAGPVEESAPIEPLFGVADPFWGSATQVELAKQTVRLMPHGVMGCPDPVAQVPGVSNCERIPLHDGALVLPRTAMINATIGWQSTAPLNPIPTLYWRHSPEASWRSTGAGAWVSIPVVPGQYDDPNATASSWQFAVRANVFSVGIHDVTVHLVADRQSTADTHVAAP